jgi:hypothetical protein
MPLRLLQDLREAALVLLFRRTVDARTYELQLPEKEEQLLSYAVHGRCLALPEALVAGVVVRTGVRGEGVKELWMAEKFCVDTVCPCDDSGKLGCVDQRYWADKRCIQYARLHPDYLQRLLRHESLEKSRAAWLQQLEAAGLEGLAIMQLQHMGPSLVVYEMVRCRQWLDRPWQPWLWLRSSSHDMHAMYTEAHSLPSTLQPCLFQNCHCTCGN